MGSSKQLNTSTMWKKLKEVVRHWIGAILGRSVSDAIVVRPHRNEVVMIIRAKMMEDVDGLLTFDTDTFKWEVNLGSNLIQMDDQRTLNALSIGMVVLPATVLPVSIRTFEDRYGLRGNDRIMKRAIEDIQTAYANVQL